MDGNCDKHRRWQRLRRNRFWTMEKSFTALWRHCNKIDWMKLGHWEMSICRGCAPSFYTHIFSISTMLKRLTSIQLNWNDATHWVASAKETVTNADKEIMRTNGLRNVPLYGCRYCFFFLSVPYTQWKTSTLRRSIKSWTEKNREKEHKRQTNEGEIKRQRNANTHSMFIKSGSCVHCSI